MEIAIVGAVVSLFTQWAKKQFGTNEYRTLAIVAVASLIAAAIYTYLKASGYWETFYGVLITAGASYAFIVARF